MGINRNLSKQLIRLRNDFHLLKSQILGCRFLDVLVLIGGFLL